MAYHKSKTSILSSLDKDYIEEGRRDIYKWGETRRTKRKGIRGWAYAFKKMFINKGILKSFVNNLTAVLALQLILSGLMTYACQRLDLYLDVNIALFVSPIIFPLAFSINADFQRRERVLEDLALLKGGLIILFFCHRDWHVNAGLPSEFLKAVNNKLKGLILNIKEYLLTEKLSKRNFILQVIYEDFSDISQMNEKLRLGLEGGNSLIQRLIHCHNLMFWAFERLRVVREYRSPRGIRSFTKVFIFVMPLVLSPYYVFVGKSSSNEWGPYYISLVSTFVFGTLQGVQDILDDPFDGISEDDVNLGSLEDWTAHSLLTNRTYTVGRFTVTTAPHKDKDEKEPAETYEAREIVSRNPSFNKKNLPVKSILRRTSNRPEVEKPDTTCQVSEENVGVLYPEMALRLNIINAKDMTGSTTILPGLQVKARPPSLDFVDNGKINGSTPVLLDRSPLDVSEAIARRRAFQKNVSFSKDVNDEVMDTGCERVSDDSNDDAPLIRQSARHNMGFGYSDPDPDKIPEHLRAAFIQLQNSSSTNRVEKPREPTTRSKTPSSLSNLFDPPDEESQGDRLQQSPAQPSSYSSTTFETMQSAENTKSNDKMQPPLIEVPNVNVQPRSRFSVSNLKNTNSPITPLPSEATTNTEKESNDSSRTSLPVENPNKDIEPKVSRFGVTPSAQSTASNVSNPVGNVNDVNVELQRSARFQVERTRPKQESDDEKQARINQDMSSPSLPSIEDTASSKENPKTSRFGVSKPPDFPTTALPDPPKKISGKGFWNFSSESIDNLASDEGAGDEVDGKEKNSQESKKSRKRSSIEDVLDLSGNRKDEVYI